MSFSFRDKIISNKGEYIHKISAIDATGKKAYYFVLVDPKREDKFLTAINNGNLDLEDYGQVIASCYGEEPTKEVKTLMKGKYGFDI